MWLNLRFKPYTVQSSALSEDIVLGTSTQLSFSKTCSTPIILMLVVT